MFEKIVAAIDTDAERVARVIDATGEVAESRGSEVLVVHVREVERPAPMVAKAGALPPLLHLESEEEARALVNSGVERLRARGIAASGRVEPGAGSTARELLDLALGYGANLIVVGDRGSKVTDLLLGGVAHRIVHLASCSVLVIR